MTEKDPILEKKLSWLKKQKEIPMIPLSGVGIVTVQGRDILEFKRKGNGALMAVTEIGEFYLIPAHQYEARSNP